MGHKCKTYFLLRFFGWDTEANRRSLLPYKDLLGGTLQQILSAQKAYGWDTKATPASSEDLFGGTLKQILLPYKICWMGHWSEACLCIRPAGGMLKLISFPHMIYGRLTNANPVSLQNLSGWDTDANPICLQDLRKGYQNKSCFLIRLIGWDTKANPAYS